MSCDGWGGGSRRSQQLHTRWRGGGPMGSAALALSSSLRLDLARCPPPQQVHLGGLVGRQAGPEVEAALAEVLGDDGLGVEGLGDVAGAPLLEGAQAGAVLVRPC
jgi:hypothetical protein